MTTASASETDGGSPSKSPVASTARWFWSVAFAGAPAPAWALVTGALADRIADVLAIVVIVIVPIAGIFVFWKVHVLPEQIAERRQHPQKEAIRVLCLLSLAFGGMLWPIAWLWAYTKPTLHKLAYGTDKHEDAGEPAAAEPKAPQEDRLALLRREIEHLLDEGAPAADVDRLRRDVARIEKRLGPPPQPGTH